MAGDNLKGSIIFLLFIFFLFSFDFCDFHSYNSMKLRLSVQYLPLSPEVQEAQEALVHPT